MGKNQESRRLAGRVASFVRSNAIGFIALAVAMGGTAAATTSVIRKNESGPTKLVVARTDSSHVAEAAKSRRGPRGRTGPAGPAGPPGSPGAPGSPGTAAAQPGGTLPSGATLRGAWAPTGERPDTAGVVGGHGVSFAYPLGARPTPHVIPVGGSATTDCPGSATAPAAASGQLCLYIVSTSGTPTTGDQLQITSTSVATRGISYSTFTAITTVLGDGTVDPWGFKVSYIDNGSNISQSYGTWAVTG
jgi:hypothetical protein